jgi:hypothetical protein
VCRCWTELISDRSLSLRVSVGGNTLQTALKSNGWKIILFELVCWIYLQTWITYENLLMRRVSVLIRVYEMREDLCAKRGSMTYVIFGT